MTKTTVAKVLRAHVDFDRSGRVVDTLAPVAIGLACELPTKAEALRWLKRAGFGHLTERFEVAWAAVLAHRASTEG